MHLNENTIISVDSSHRMRDMCGTAPALYSDLDHAIDQKRFNIRMANSHGRNEAASVLIKKMYSLRGYSVGQVLGSEPNKITLVADTAGRTVGTMTVYFDTEVGLPADENFRDKVDELRAQERKICEPSKLAIDVDVPKRVFASMIHISYIYAHNIRGYTDYVIEVNPRHAVFYKRMLGFHDFGEQRNCTRVDAPAVLLRLEHKHMSEKIRKLGGSMKQPTAERSFYPYFFSHRDEAGITERLVARST